MRILLHDYSGHPFQAELSRELSRRGHEVVHSFCAAYTSGKGRLAAEPGERVTFEAIGVDEVVEKLDFRRRLIQELRFGRELIDQVRRLRPDVVMAANVPIPTLTLLTAWLLLRRIPWVLWHQDVQAVAIDSFAGTRLSPAFGVVARVVGLAERWCARRAASAVVIARSFLDVHRRWGTADKATVIANWAPVQEIRPVPRVNAWSREHGLDDVPTILYSGTLGLKHNPSLLVALTREVNDAGIPARLVVVSEGPAGALLRAEADRLGVAITLLPFQPYDVLPEVLGSADVLVVLLERDAGAFSVPSKTLSYLCAGRPVLGLMPAENLAASLVERSGGAVFPPDEAAVSRAARWVADLLADAPRRDEVGANARKLAEDEFALTSIGDRFEAVLTAAVR